MLTKIPLLRQAVDRNQFAIFAGAGISRNSGLPLARELLTEILVHLGTEQRDLEYLVSAVPFELFIQAIEGAVDWEGVSSLLELFGMGIPNATHQLLAELATTGRAFRICTTNFDELIEAAVRSRSPTTDLRVRIRNDSLLDIDWEEPSPLLIKLHGSVGERAEIATTLRSVASRTLSAARQQALEGFFCARDRTVLVLGYSCSDAFDLSPALREIGARGCRVIFIDHRPGLEQVKPMASKPEPNPFREFPESVWIQCDTDALISDIWDMKFNGGRARPSTGTVDWRRHVRHWASCARTYNPDVDLLVCARISHEGARYERLLDYARRGEVRASARGDALARMNWLGNLGNASANLGDLVSARKWLEATIALAHELGDASVEARAISTLGNVHLEQGENVEAVECYEAAEAVLRERLEQAPSGSMICSLASALICCGRLEQARLRVDTALERALSEGDPHGLQHALGLRGDLNKRDGDAHAAIANYDKAIAIARDLGDRRWIGAWLKRRGEAMPAGNERESYLREALLHLEAACGPGHSAVLELRAALEV